MGGEGGSPRGTEDDALTTVLGLLRSVRSRWWVVPLIAVPVIVGAVFFTERLPAVYQVESIVLVEPRPDGGPVTGSPIVQLKAPTYVAYITAPATATQLADELGTSTSTVSESLDASVQPDTGNVTVTVRSTSPDQATRLASAAAETLVEFSTGDELLQAEVIAPPVHPTSPAGPPRRLIEAAAVVVALGLAVLVAVLVDRRRPRIAEARDVEFATGDALLGRLPRRRRLPTAPNAAFADPVVGTAARSLRVRLIGDLRAGSSLTVTSAVAGEGKTTVAALLATAFARSGMSVALVDGDLRRARLHSLLDGDAGPGLAALVRGRASLDACVRPGWTEHLDVLPTTADEHAGELLSEHFPDVLRDLRIRYDLVVVDAPPLLATDEAKVFAATTDTVVSVVAVGTARDAVLEAHDLLVGLRAPVTGYVLNRATLRTGQYGYGTYQYEEAE